MRILLAIILASTFFATLVTGLHLYGNYREDVNALDVRLRDAESTFLPSLIDAVWRIDKPLISLNLNAIAQLPYISYIALNTPDIPPMGLGKKLDGRFQEIKRYNLTYELENEAMPIGKLILQVNHREIFESLGREALVLLGLNGLKTLTVSLLILFILETMLFRYLRRMRNTASHLSMDNLSEPFLLGRNEHHHVDELDEVCQSLDSMRIRIDQGVKELKTTRAERERVYRAASESETAVVIFNDVGAICYLNVRFEKMLSDLAIDLPARLDAPSAVDTLLISIDHELSAASLIEALDGELPIWQRELFLLSVASGPCWLELRCITYINTYDEEQQYILSFQDMTELKNAYVRQRELMETDVLTGLPNLRVGMVMLYERLKITQNNNSHLALFLVSLQAYKPVLESFGLEYADLMLLKATKIMADIAPPDMLLIRAGEHEFISAFELQSAHASVALGYVDDLNKAFMHPIQLNEHLIDVDLFGGIAISPNDGETHEKLVQHAMSALHRAQARPTESRFYFYEPAMKQGSFRRLYIAAQIRSGQFLEEIDVHYQPILKADGTTLVACEALARWNSQTLGMIAPTEFIYDAERLHAISLLGETILQRACLQAAKWLPLAPAGFYVSVNVSPLQVEERDFIKIVSNALSLANLPAQALKLEVTEQLLLHGHDYVLEKLNQLKQMGVRVAIDDFGSGYASLNYLCNYPFQILKVDQSFVFKLLEEESNRIMVAAIIRLAHSLGLETIAEGIENLETKLLLEEMGCDLLQGYFFSVPLAAIDFEAYMTDGKFGLEYANLT